MKKASASVRSRDMHVSNGIAPVEWGISSQNGGDGMRFHTANSCSLPLPFEFEESAAASPILRSYTPLH